MGFSDDQLMAREAPDLRESARGLSDDDLLRREGLAAPRAKPAPPPTAGEQYAKGLAAGHFKDDEETPLSRTLRAGQEQMDVPDSGYMNRALNAWQAMAAQGAGEALKGGANLLGIETGPAEQFAGEAMSALPGLMGAEGVPHIAPRAAEAVKPARERIEPIPPQLPEAPSAAKTALVNIAQGKPADAPPVEQAPVARAPEPQPPPVAPAPVSVAPEAAPVAPLTVTPEATPGMWPEPVVDNKEAAARAAGNAAAARTGYPPPGSRVAYTDPQGKERTGTVQGYGVVQPGSGVEPRMHIVDDDGFDTQPTPEAAQPRLLGRVPREAPKIAPGESAPRPQPTQRAVQGLNVNIENPQGSLRTGTGDNGQPWQVHMPADYGEILGTKGADGSPVDAYVGPHPESRRAFVIDQYDPQGNFDEHKVVLAARTAKDATAIYDAGFSDGSGPARRGAITEVPISRLKAWLKDGDTTQPFAGSEHAAPPAPKEAPVRRPVNIAEFLARSGGIARDPGGDLEAMDLHKQFVPGAGMLVRKNGRQLDYAREIAEEAGYLPEGSTTADLLDALDRNRRGNHVFSHKDTGDVVAWKDQEIAKGRASRADAQEGPEVEGAPPSAIERHELESRAEGLGIERHAHLSDEELLAEIHEREAMMAEGPAKGPHADHMAHDLDSAVRGALPEEHDEIPGFEPPEARARPTESANKTGERRQAPAGETPSGEGAGEIVPGDREAPYEGRGPREGLDEESPSPEYQAALARMRRADELLRQLTAAYRKRGLTDQQYAAAVAARNEVAKDFDRAFKAEQARKTAPTERTNQGQQQIMPGMERSARQAQASREDAGRGMITPTRPQKPADEGLFAKPSQQPDMFDKATREAAHANADALRQAWASAKPDTVAPLSDDFARFAAMRGGMPTTAIGRALLAADYIVRRGTATGHEALVGIGRDGSVVEAKTQGEKNRVDFSDSLIARMRDPNEQIITHHNHPSNSALSRGDLGTLYHPGHDTVIAYGRDGELSSARLTPRARKLLDPSSPASHETILAVHKAADDAAYEVMKPLVDSGKVSLDVANAVHPELVVRALEAARLIDYIGTRRPETLLEPEIYRRAFEHAAAAAMDTMAGRGLAQELTLGEMLTNARLYRPTEPLRPADAMARILETARGDATEPASALRGQARAGDDRAQGPRGAQGRPAAGVDKRGQYRLLEDEDRYRQEALAGMGGAGGRGRPPGGGAGAGGRGGPPRQGQMPVTTPQQARKNGIIARSIIGRIFSPTTVSPIAGQTEALIRKEIGQSVRLTQQARAQLETFRHQVGDLPQAEQNAFIDYVENRSQGAQLRNPALLPAANKLRQIFENRMHAIRQLGSAPLHSFVQDYFPHQWQDTKRAAQVGQQIASTTRSGGWQGSGRNLKTRTIPTVADGLAAGLVPVHANPLEATMAYVSNMDRFIGTNRIFDTMEANGTAKYFTPGQQPDGWVELKGRLSDKNAPLPQGGAIPMKAYAPEDAARVYNNFIGRGFHENAEAGWLYDKLMRANNLMTSYELALSAFHATTMAREAMVSQVARAVGDLHEGQIGKALKDFALFPAAPVRNYFAGRALQREYVGPGVPSGRANRFVDTVAPYLGGNTGSARLGQLANILGQVGGRAVGRGSSEYFSSGTGPYTSIRSFTDAFRDAARDAQAHPVAGTARQLAVNVGRTMDTVAAPLFDHTIPRLKNGAWMERMNDWLERNPSASHDEQLAYGRKLWDSVDNRFGELVYDNLFWNRALKQTGQVVLRALGWDLGTHREIEGGVADVLRGRWSPRVEYLIALPVVMGITNAVATYLKTETAPTGMDFFAYRTGGTNDDGTPERAMFPGYDREYIGAFFNMLAKGPAKGGQEYAWGKVSSLWHTAHDLFTNRDWKEDPIGPPSAGVSSPQARAQLPDFALRYVEDLLSRFAPISTRGALGLDQSKPAKNISPVEKALSVRKAPAAVQNLERQRYWEQRRAKDLREKTPEQRWKAKIRKERQAS